MPVDNSGTSNSIPIYKPPKNPGGGGGGGGTTPPVDTSPGGGGGGGGGGFDPYAYARRQQRKADRAAAKQHLDVARTLQDQIDSIRVALGRKGFIKALRQELHDINLATRTAETELVKGYRERVGSLKQSSEDNLAAAAGQGYANVANRSRERANAVSEAMLQGAGESDLLRSQQMSLNNWNANQNEVNRAFADTRSSINSSLTDLTVDTRTARISNAQQGIADRKMLWNTYYDNRAETLTNLGNTYGQQASEYSMANQAVGSKKTRRKQRRASRRSGEAIEQSALETGKAWKSPGVSKRLRDWEGAADFEGKQNNSVFSNAPTEMAQARPEGATLRQW